MLFAMKKTEPLASHEESLGRLSRIGGQVRGIRAMVEEKKYCIDIIIQIQAARAALRAVEMKILWKHMHYCVRDAFASASNASADKKMEELMRVMKKQY